MRGCNRKAVATSGLASVALLLTLLGNFWCQYGYQTVVLTSNVAGNVTGQLYQGIWGYQDYSYFLGADNANFFLAKYSYCKSYGSIGVNTLWQSLNSWTSLWAVAAAFTIIASVVGGILAVLTCFFASVNRGRLLWRLLGLGFLITCVFQGLTLLYFQSNHCQQQTGVTGRGDRYIAATGCMVGTGAKIGIAATILWFLTAVMTLITANDLSEQRKEKNQMRKEEKQKKKEEKRMQKEAKLGKGEDTDVPVEQAIEPDAAQDTKTENV